LNWVSGDHIYLFNMNDSHDITQDLNAKKSDSTDEDMENLSDDGK